MKDIKNSQKNSVDEFDAFNDDEEKLFNSFFEKVKLSKQMRREFCEWLPEIAYSKKTTIFDILRGDGLTEIMDSEKLNGPQKLSKLRDVLYHMRFPELSKVKDEWQSLIKQINPDKSKVQFKSDPYFEKSEIEINIKASSYYELKNLLGKLLTVDEVNWDKIIDPFKGVC